MNALHAALAAFLVTFAALFPIVNPIEAAPFYHVLTHRLGEERQRLLARKVAVAGFALLAGCMALGPWVLEVLGVELPVVRIAGGLVVTTLGWKLLTQENWSDHAAGQVPADAMDREGAFYPLTMPLTVGPGSMSVAVSIGSRRPAGGLDIAQAAAAVVGAVAGLVAIGLSIYIAYRFAGRVARLLGASGVEVLVRLSAFILMCIGIEFLWSGALAMLVAHPLNGQLPGV
jgi:multiple antibiotic resistance protein